MRNNTRLAVGLCILGAAACAHPGTAVPRVEPAAAASAVPAGQVPEGDGNGHRFFLRSAPTAEAAEQQPLFYMDGNLMPGVPYLRPDEVASVEVVTGEAAAQRFGVSPERKVVLITTTWGQARDRS